ncbi:hypothetical protein [Paucilactobacillus hokkaidonensis]|uniref:hypothetical protein n=1 Tax=Paucilactobacillus hokkaidonensis TaxID=1193095 RepID=UPI0006D04837|nr:hypothetical protein [Paucilactobacillus hokkaidonensis]
MTSINRYHDYGTLKYVLRSIANNMNWVDNVILVTDNQLPEWLNTREVRVVDHKEFINGKLPTFNSNVIMTNLDKIPQLNEQFIAFNDETIVWNAVKKTDFFKNNLPVDSLIETGTVPKNDGFYHISLNGVALINERFSKRNVMLKKI